MPEIRRLWQRLLPVAADFEQGLAWSHWCRCHPWVALHCHYRRQQATTMLITTVVLGCHYNLVIVAPDMHTMRAPYNGVFNITKDAPVVDCILTLSRQYTDAVRQLVAQYMLGPVAHAVARQKHWLFMLKTLEGILILENRYLSMFDNCIFIVHVLFRVRFNDY